MKRTKLFVIAGSAVLVVGACIGVYMLLGLQSQARGIASIQLEDKWAQATSEPTVQGKIYSVDDQLVVGATTRFSSSLVPSGWHITEDSGSGDEAAVYNLESDDKKTKIKTINLASDLAGQYSTQVKCTEELTSRYVSSDFLKSSVGAAEGSVVSDAYTTYTVATTDGNGIVMGRIDYSYKDSNGLTQYGIRFLRCSTKNILSISITGSDKTAVMNAVADVVKQLAVRL